jgi:hypothetical protein
MKDPEYGRDAENSEGLADSLNSDVVEVTSVQVDHTVRPMREALRQRLRTPPTFPQSTEPRHEQRPS